MSAVVIKLIPKDPEFVPDDTKLSQLKEWIATNVSNNKTEYILTDEVRFIDQGGNFENVSCPFCSNIITLDWWSEEMDKASETSFHNLSVVTDCCNKDTYLNELEYKWNAGFSRFSIEIMNPKDELNENNMEYIGELLGCPIMIVVAYY
ncbi:hypothetical protein [Paenibacillus sp. N3.4]|uniref:hypothetical protein n=1 Tax=Paenibacillus sp. N3.4 TaxID=2603222 RepID=UPI0011C8F756|nr:hypothetical protein [Paenibacillus sp. N3.4]TXK83444.1 hypothetical protein FU659_13725 [Paenibacillus sp. N3.4]